MQSIREFNRKIKSLKNTRKVTGSMKMLSSVKLQRYLKLRQRAAPFWEHTMSVLSRFSASGALDRSSFQCAEKPSPEARIVLITGDRGLCGRYNTNAIREAIRLSESLRGGNLESNLTCVGARGASFVRRRQLSMGDVFETAKSGEEYLMAVEISKRLIDSFESAAACEVWLVYTQRVTSVTLEPVSEKILPVPLLDSVPAQADRSGTDYIVEESVALNGADIPELYVRSRVYRALIESSVSEHGARMSAMDTATANADRMIARYEQLRNRARQSMITTELTEIVAGKEAID